MARKSANKKRPRDGDCNQKKTKRPRMQHIPVLSQVNEGKKSNIASLFVFGNEALGVEGKEKSNKPVLVTNLEDQNILDFTAGLQHNAAIVTSRHTRGRHLYTWGNNDDNVLGREGDDGLAEVVEELDGKAIVQVSTGEYHMAALSNKGHVFSWGNYRQHKDDADSYLGFKSGRDPSENQPTPEYLEELEEHYVIQISSTNNTTLALTDKGEVFEWGDIRYGKVSRRNTGALLVPNRVLLNCKVQAVYSGSNHNLALTTDGLVYGWGANSKFQLGLGLKNNRDRDRPQRVKVLDDLIELDDSGDHPIQEIACGAEHNLILLKNGDLFAFGGNEYGQLGIGGTSDHEKEPQQVEIGEEVVQVAAGEWHSVALTASGKLYAWGKGGALGQSNNQDKDTPTEVTDKALNGWTIVKVTAGNSHTGLIATN
eukprot:TRINITY_DN10187_c0_g1_i1.p1 TRINITY_DN10187_c0_g1~~TRINITY_DN10187_c0_g1_i1.p1  ORF type:complete len:442 (+),score=133.12 TRINITY_DN10187_c0_g1_i1:49-1326(+)